MKNFFQKIDNLSSIIELKYKGKNGYKNAFGGILTLIVYILTFAISIFFSLNLLERNDPKSYTVKKYVESGGTQMDQKNLFHFFALFDSATNTIIDLEDYKSILNVNAYVSVFYNNNLMQYTYDKCLLEDFAGLESFYTDLVKDYYFCIRKMKDFRSKSSINNTTEDQLKWKENLLEINDENNLIVNKDNVNSNNNKDDVSNNNKTKKYKLNPEFVYPWMTIEKPEALQEIKYFRIEITKCQNSTDKNYKCKPEKEIEEKTANLFFQLKFIDNMFDVGNYNEPISKYINQKSVAIKKNTLSNLYLNFYAVNIITRDGFIFDTNKKRESSALDFHSEAFTETKANVIHETQFWILNNAQNYERSYPKLQNVAAEIGGLYRFFFIVGSIINFIFEKYTNFIINDNLLDLLGICKEEEELSFGKQHESVFQPKYLNERIEFSKIKSKKNYVINENESEIVQMNNFDNKQIMPTKVIIDNMQMKFNDNNNNNNKKNQIQNQSLNSSANNIYEKAKQNMDINKKLANKNKMICLNFKNEEINDHASGLDNENERKKNIYDFDKNVFDNSFKKKEFLNNLKNNKNININLNNNKVNSSINNNFSSCKVLEKNEEKRFGRSNIEKTKNKTSAHKEIEKTFLSPLNKQASKYNFNSKSKSISETKENFYKFFCFYLKCGNSQKVSSGVKLRNILLDELNIYKLHLDLIKIKKIINKEFLAYRNVDSISISFNEILKNYMIFS